MKKYRFTKDYMEYKKDTIIEYDKETYHGFTHRLIMRGILEVVGQDKEEIKDKFSYTFLKDMTMKQQDMILKVNYGMEDNEIRKLKKEEDKIQKILQLQEEI